MDWLPRDGGRTIGANIAQEVEFPDDFVLRRGEGGDPNKRPIMGDWGETGQDVIDYMMMGMLNDEQLRRMQAGRDRRSQNANPLEMLISGYTDAAPPRDTDRYGRMAPDFIPPWKRGYGTDNLPGREEMLRNSFLRGPSAYATGDEL